MGRTTNEWAALLDGTTPGPWTVVETAYRRAICRIRDDGQSGWAVALTLDHTQPDLDEANATLVAAAPDAVAEVIRLRRAITDLRDDYLVHIADYDETTVTHMCYGTAADDLDRILNGDTDH